MFCVACCGVLLFTAEAQEGNLVPNPGFEDRIECISNDSDVSDAPPWFSPTAATPDVFHECAIVNSDPCPYPETVALDPWMIGIPTNFIGCQSPHDGVGYAGAFFMNPGASPENEWREYLAVRLLEPLESSSIYSIGYFASLAERSMVATWSLSVGLSNDSLIFDDNHIVHISPPIILTNDQGEFINDTDDWHEVSFTYEANGGEEFIYIGNFESNEEIEFEFVIDESDWPGHFLESAYYYIDDVFVEKISDVSQREKMTSEIRFHPTITNGAIKTNSPRCTVFQVVNSVGAIIQTLDIQVGNNTFDLNHLSPGIYFLVERNEHRSKTQKIIMQ